MVLWFSTTSLTFWWQKGNFQVLIKIIWNDQGQKWMRLVIHSSPKEVHIEFIPFSRWPGAADPDPGSCQVCQMVFGVICDLLSQIRKFDKIKMTRGRGRWPRDLRKLGWFSCAKHSEKSVWSVPWGLANMHLCHNGNDWIGPRAILPLKAEMFSDLATFDLWPWLSNLT